MSSVIKMDVQGLLPLKRQMQLLAMPRNTRRRLLYRVAKRVIADSKRRIRKQVDLNGSPFAARSKKRSRKMLSRLVKELKVRNNNSLEATIGFQRPSSGRIASAQQHGKTSRVSATRFSKGNKLSFYDKPATRKQAKALRETGFKIKKANGKGTKPPTLKWVTENMTVGTAGYALRQLRVWSGGKIKTSWVTELPARSFLGATAAEVSAHIETIFKQMKQEMNYVAR